MISPQLCTKKIYEPISIVWNQAAWLHLTDSPRYSVRVYPSIFENKTAIIELFIPHAAKNDSGVYLCQKSLDDIQRFHLNVHGEYSTTIPVLHSNF